MNERARQGLARFRELEEMLADPSVTSNIDRLREIGKERADLEELAQAAAEWERMDAALTEAREVAHSGDEDLTELAAAEIEELEPKLTELAARLKILSVPKDPDDSRNAIVEVRAGTGGDEAALFAGEVFRMYQRFADRRKWKTEVLEVNETELGGVKEATFSLQGDGAFGVMRYESGVHRVQRVPATETSGRIHTSAVSVAVLPEAAEVDVSINPNDLRIDVFRSQGPGGQSVNTTDSAVRITHEPTGLVVTCQDEKSQHKNKAKALRVLRSRLLDQEREAAASERAEARRSQIGSGDRSEKIRTYNFPQNRVTDHRIGLSLHSIDAVMAGEFDELVDAVRQQVVAEILGGD
ncbi:MAG: peptide chain release factor 1 [Gemmatimonadota bacterium]|jgi:peptide chain release factor 1|nr:peptide chain release factor 1 [Gemmatimonadota bacterium]MDP6529621.1 peptide chain release factor 1 [Gemmatimonadota bacterium]MDP6803157.1 peptide chain release factor 1 [Gemmatimonadota bacterium]MDP7030674.1 peptide chain release factor 1 [Gemmatimonadota bacterium]